MAKIFICESCEQECELIELDDGGLEEVWGAMIWHQQWVSYSECCRAEYEEVAEDGSSNNLHM